MGGGWHEWPLLIFRLWSVRGRWFYCSETGADEGACKTQQRVVRLYVWSVKVLVGIGFIA